MPSASAQDDDDEPHKAKQLKIGGIERMCTPQVTQNVASDPQTANQLVSFVQQYGSYFTSSVNAILVSLENVMISVGKDAFVFLIILGVLLYYTHVARRLGKDFLAGGVIIGIFTTFGAPYLMTAASC